MHEGERTSFFIFIYKFNIIFLITFTRSLRGMRVTYNRGHHRSRSPPMFRLLLIAAAIWIVWRILKGFRIHIERVQPPPPEKFEPTARCAKCGTHLPAAALSKSGTCGRCSE